jgi:hypothetical protein
MIEAGLYSLIKTNIPDFNGTTDYQMYYLAVFDPVPPPYCVFRRYKREAEQDLSSTYGLFTSAYVMNIYHTDSWALLDLQRRIRELLESLPLTTVGGIFVQGLLVTDDYHTTPPLIQETRVRAFQGVLDFEIIHSTD